VLQNKMKVRLYLKIRQ